jgi:V/A-type H+-transporting ATPase subunit I
MIAPMTKLALAVPQSSLPALLQFLQNQEILHPTPLEATTSSAPPTLESGAALTSRLAEVETCLQFISTMRQELKLQPPQASLLARLRPVPPVSLEALEQTLAQLPLANLVKQVNHLNTRLAQLAAAENSYLEEKAQLEPWQSLTITPQELLGSSSSQLFLITFGTQEEELITAKLSRISTAAWQEVSRQSKNKKTGTLFWEVVVHKSETDQVAELLSDTNAAALKLPLQPTQTPQARLLELEQLAQVSAQERHTLLASAKQLLDQERPLKLSYDALLHHQERQRLTASLINYFHISLLSGWVPTRRLEAFTQALVHHFPAAYYAELSPDPAEKPPVALANHPLVEPFEAVTDLYGKPQYHELDPTPFLSFFFLISFGLALSDAGYGLLMALATGLANRFIPLKKDLRKMVNLLFYTGLATMVFGALMGSWFSIDLVNLPSHPIRNALLSIKVLDPIAEPMSLLFVAFVIGILQLMFARLVKAYDYWRTGQYQAALLDEVSWFTLLIFLFAWLASRQNLLPLSWGPVLWWLLLVNAVLLVLTQGRQQKNPFLRLGTGLLSLYGLIGFMSDTLSYARLLALGLATSIIGLVVNLIAGLAADSVPVLGIFLAGLVLVAGHLFNLGINALGAFIHSGRLQYVEFFPKFLEGGGVPFKPLGRVGKYVN